MLTEERKAELDKMWGKALLMDLRQKLQKKEISLEEYLASFEYWLTKKGYIKTNMGWLKPQQIAEMGLVKRGDHWAIGSKEQVTRRIIGVGRNQREEIITNHIPNEVKPQPSPQLSLRERRENFEAVQDMSEMVSEVFEVEEEI